jgi:hypothetical protein
VFGCQLVQAICTFAHLRIKVVKIRLLIVLGLCSLSLNLGLRHILRKLKSFLAGGLFFRLFPLASGQRIRGRLDSYFLCIFKCRFLFARGFFPFFRTDIRA